MPLPWYQYFRHIIFDDAAIFSSLIWFSLSLRWCRFTFIFFDFAIFFFRSWFRFAIFCCCFMLIFRAMRIFFFRLSVSRRFRLRLFSFAIFTHCRCRRALLFLIITFQLPLFFFFYATLSLLPSLITSCHYWCLIFRFIISYFRLLAFAPPRVTPISLRFFLRFTPLFSHAMFSDGWIFRCFALSPLMLMFRCHEAFSPLFRWCHIDARPPFRLLIDACHATPCCPPLLLSPVILLLPSLSFSSLPCRHASRFFFAALLMPICFFACWWCLLPFRLFDAAPLMRSAYAYCFDAPTLFAALYADARYIAFYRRRLLFSPCCDALRHFCRHYLFSCWCHLIIDADIWFSPRFHICSLSPLFIFSPPRHFHADDDAADAAPSFFFMPLSPCRFRLIFFDMPICFISFYFSSFFCFFSLMPRLMIFPITLASILMSQLAFAMLPFSDFHYCFHWLFLSSCICHDTAYWYHYFIFFFFFFFFIFRCHWHYHAMLLPMLLRHVLPPRRLADFMLMVLHAAAIATMLPLPCRFDIATCRRSFDVATIRLIVPYAWCWYE